MSTEPRTDTRTRWGRIKFAGGRIPAMAVAIPAGLILAAGVGALTLLTGVSQGEQALIIAGVFTLIMSWGLIGLIWALVVDHSSLRGHSTGQMNRSSQSGWKPLWLVRSATRSC